MANHSLSTIGYEGASLEDFVQTLLVARVTLICDIRERAQSRRKGFSKSALSARLEKAGIRYVHFRELGDPKPGREAARAGDMVTFRRVYAAVLKTPEAIAAMQAIAESMKQDVVCLLCYERSFEDCHRKLVSDKIELRVGCKTRHLGVKHFGKASSLQR